MKEIKHNDKITRRRFGTAGQLQRADENVDDTRLAVRKSSYGTYLSRLGPAVGAFRRYCGRGRPVRTSTHFKRTVSSRTQARVSVGAWGVCVQINTR
jgi:hypothetical protein